MIESQDMVRSGIYLCFGLRKRVDCCGIDIGHLTFLLVGLCGAFVSRGKRPETS